MCQDVSELLTAEERRKCSEIALDGRFLLNGDTEIGVPNLLAGIRGLCDGSLFQISTDKTRFALLDAIEL